MKTRKVSYQDGRHEVIGIWNDERLSGWSQDDPMAYESSILWLEDVERLPYVRSMYVHNCESRRGKLVPRGGGRVVGYSKLTDNAPVDGVTGGYVRRVFYLSNADLSSDSHEMIAPRDAIDPTTILPGLKGNPPNGKQKPMPHSLKAKTQTVRQKVRQSESQDTDVMQWLNEAVTPDLGSVRHAREAGASQASIDTELAHDEPASVDRPTSAPAQRTGLGTLVPKGLGKPIPLTKLTISIGRMEQCDVVIPFSNVSGLHCQLTLDEGFWFVEDLHSTNGTKINGMIVQPHQKKPIDPGMILSVGKHEFEIRYDPV